jgi:hypothetical protein
MVKASLILCGIIIAACRGISLDPEAGDGAAVVPRDGSEYSYSVVHDGSRDTTFESVRICCTGKKKFIALRDLNGTSIQCDTFLIRTDGDLEANRFNEVYPVQTHGSYVLTSHFFDVGAHATYRYDGADRLKVGDSSYLCSRIKGSLSTSNTSSATVSEEMTYWYSAKAGFFVKERRTSSTNKELNYERRLIAIK